MSEEFIEAEEFWFLDKLYEDLAKHKTKHLSRVEKLHLRGLLNGLSPNQIALKLNKDVEEVQADLSKTIYAYVKLLLNKPVEEKIENWRCIPKWLEEKGYRKPLERNGNNFPIENLDAIIKLVNNVGGVHKEKFTVEINISFQTSFPVEHKQLNVKTKIVKTNKSDVEIANDDN